MQLALKHILILFIICSRECHANRPCLLVKMPTGKRLKSQRKEVVANVYDYFEELSRCKWTQGPLKRKADATGLSRASIKSRDG